MINITSWTDLNTIRDDLTGDYQLTRDLLSADLDYEGIGDTWTPINGLSGTFDGQGFKIHNLTVNVTGSNNAGLFAYLLGTVSNLGLIDVDITGQSHIGALVGKNRGSISNCYSTGNINGSSSSTGYIGGLVGYLESGLASVTNSYSTVVILGGNSFGNGGLIGVSYQATIINSYSTGSVTGSGTNGGLIGWSNGTTTDCFWDTDTSGLLISSGGTGKTTIEMQTLSTFTNVGWDFGTSPIWYFLIGNYPSLEQFIIPTPEIIETDTLSLSDEIELNLSLEKIIESDTLSLSDESNLTSSEVDEDLLNISDKIELTYNMQENDTLSLLDTIELIIGETYDLVNDFHYAKQELININNKFSSCQQVLSDTFNFINTIKGNIINFTNKINSKRQELYNLKNDIRTLLSFQVPGDAGFQSLGKEYIKVYINSIEQTDVNIDSISITKSLNTAHTATFELSRPYDSTKPTLELPVEIKYYVWTLYKGYITKIVPSDEPESIRINCQDQYWYKNKTKVYFNIGHKPTDNTELYYNTIAEGLLACGISFGVGNFIPQTINVFGIDTSSAISDLVRQSGNFSWYYEENGTPVLWRAGAGDIINISKQEIGKNLGLYQVLSHNISEDSENIINQYRVQMGQKVNRKFGLSGSEKTYSGYNYCNTISNSYPEWQYPAEVLAKNSPNGYGWDYHPASYSAYYADVFKKYRLDFLDDTVAEWTDRYPPVIYASDIYTGIGTVITEGFTVDYKEETVTFNEPFYVAVIDASGEVLSCRRPALTLYLFKKQFWSWSNNPSDDPTHDISNPLMFFTGVRGDIYSTTIQGLLNLQGLNIQIGGRSLDKNGKIIIIPSWDDTVFATDYAEFQLSKVCNKKISGQIELTLDAICFYNISLNKRIMVDGILNNPLNIISMTYNISNFTTTVQLNNDIYYNRTVSLQSHGE